MVPRREQRRCHRLRRTTARSPSTGIIANGFEPAPLTLTAGGAGFCVGEGVGRTRFRDFGRAPGQKPRSQVGREGMWCPSQPSECQRTQPLFHDLGFCRIWQMELRPLALLRGGAHQIPGFWESAGAKAQVAWSAGGNLVSSWRERAPDSGILGKLRGKSPGRRNVQRECGAQGTHRHLTGAPKAKKKAPTLGAKGPKPHSKQPKN